MSRRFVTMLAAVAALAMLVGGCGGSDEEPLTKAEFIKQGSAICEESKKQIGPDLEKYAKAHESEKGPRKAKEAKVIAEVLLPTFQAQVDDLRALAAPSGDEEQITKMLDMLESGLEEGTEDPGEFVRDGDNQVTDGRQLVEKYGVEGCMVIF